MQLEGLGPALTALTMLDVVSSAFSGHWELPPVLRDLKVRSGCAGVGGLEGCSRELVGALMH